MRLELARRHDILRLRLVVRVPLGHLLHVLGVAVGGSIVLGMVVLRIGIVVHWRVRLWRHVVVVLLMVLSPSLVHGTRGRAIMARHHERRAAVLPLQPVAGLRDQAADLEATGGAARRRTTAAARSRRA
jgi:hypothetical protein